MELDLRSDNYKQIFPAECSKAVHLGKTLCVGYVHTLQDTGPWPYPRDDSRGPQPEMPPPAPRAPRFVAGELSHCVWYTPVHCCACSQFCFERDS